MGAAEGRGRGCSGGPFPAPGAGNEGSGMCSDPAPLSGETPLLQALSFSGMSTPGWDPVLAQWAGRFLRFTEGWEIPILLQGPLPAVRRIHFPVRAGLELSGTSWVRPGQDGASHAPSPGGGHLSKAAGAQGTGWDFGVPRAGPGAGLMMRVGPFHLRKSWDPVIFAAGSSMESNPCSCCSSRLPAPAFPGVGVRSWT